jgi:PAS domain S-box-containing protein
VDAVVISGADGDQVYSLAGAEQPYRVYVERMQEGAVTVSAEGMVLYCNERFADMVEYPLERVISSDLRHYLQPDAWKELRGVFGDAAKVIKHETVIHSAKGKNVPVYLSATQLPLGEQNVMCLVVTDLTAQKAQEEMRMAKELAEKANNAKDSFLARLSHELRTPLTPALLAVVELEEDDGLPDAQRRQLSMVRRNIELEARLIDDLLDLTRIASGKLELHPSLMDLHTVLERALEICRPELDSKRIHVQLHLDAAAASVMGDAVRIQQVFWNIIRNAIKFTPDGGAITIRTVDAEDSRICVKITDTGIGFAPERAATLFAAFEQGGRQITQRFGGLGLGLAISQSIVGSHHGSISAESRGMGKGATFVVELPLAPVGSKTAPLAKPSSKGEGAAGPVRILLVEDHPDTQQNLCLLLERKQHQVRTAESGEKALAIAAKERFDLVISDLGLPDMSGLELMRSLRDQFALRGIAVSGFGMDEDVALSRHAGFVRHLTKPIRIERLVEAVREVVEGA